MKGEIYFTVITVRVCVFFLYVVVVMNPNIPRKRVVKADTTEAPNKKKAFKDERFIAPRQLLLQQGYAPSLDQGPGSLLELSKAVDFLHTNHLATIPPSVSMVDYPKRVGVGADGVIIQKNVPAFLNKLYKYHPSLLICDVN